MPGDLEECLTRISSHSHAIVRGSKKAAQNIGNYSSNCGVVFGAKAAIVIDTLGFPSHGHALRDSIRQIGLEPRYVVNTHFHLDHTFGNQAFEDIVKIMQVRALAGLEHHREDLFSAEKIELRIHRDPSSEWMRELVIMDPDITFEKELSIRLDDVQLRVRHTGGHSPDQTVVLIVNDGVLFAGDLLVTGKYPYMGRPGGLYWGMCNIDDWIQGLKLIEAWDPEIVVPGHGETTGVGAVVSMREYLEKLLDCVTSLADKGTGPREISTHPELPRLLSGRDEERSDNALSVYKFLHPDSAIE